MTNSRREIDIVVIGGGLVGMAIAYGLRALGLVTMVLDDGDLAFRAARANFGLIWIQTKGYAFRPYATLSRLAAELWPAFAAELQTVSGCDIGYEHDGGFYLCHSEQDWSDRAALMRRQFDENLPIPGAYQMMERRSLEKLLPGLGPAVVGGCYCRLDGAVNPPRFFRALHAGYQARGGLYRSNEPAREIRPDGDGFAVATPAATYRAPKVVLAAGLANATLATQVGMTMPVRAVRGQILVTQKLPQQLRYPTHTIRQLGEGTIILGDSHEEVGRDDGTDPNVMSVIARRAIKSFPFLSETQLVRVWGGLRTMTADGFPLYLRSPLRRGAYAANVHSGVTLAPVHASALATAIANDTVEARFPDFARVRP